MHEPKDSSTELEPSSATTAQAESTLPSSSSPRAKREHEETDEAATDVPKKRCRTEKFKADHPERQNGGPSIKGRMGMLQRSLDWLEGNEDMTDEVKQHARQLRALVCNPSETNFRGYKIEMPKADDDPVKAQPEGAKEDTTKEDTTQEDTKEDVKQEKTNPHTDVPPPFPLPDKSKFTQMAALDKLNKLAPAISTLPPMPAAKNYSTTYNPAAPFNTTLPPAPQITNVVLSMAPFMHASLLPAYVAPTGTNSYEPLEFLGDAYLEVIATRLIHSRFPLHTVGQKAGLRELLVKNETLAEYSTAYGFGERVQSSHKERHGPVWTKVLADVFEAYLACIIIQDESSDAGFLIAERWLTELWAPKILEWRNRGDGLHDAGKDANQPLDPKSDLQRLIAGKDARLEYREEKEMQLIKEGNRTIFFIGVYLTGWGFQNQHLGSGEGRSKQIASTAAAEAAMRNSQDIIETAHQRKTYYEKQFKKSGHGRGPRGGGSGGFAGGYGAGGFGRGGGGGGRGGFPQHQGARAFPPQHQAHPGPYGQPPVPGNWFPPHQG